MGNSTLVCGSLEETAAFCSLGRRVNPRTVCPRRTSCSRAGCFTSARKKGDKLFFLELPTDLTRAELVAELAPSRSVPRTFSLWAPCWHPCSFSGSTTGRGKGYLVHLKGLSERVVILTKAKTRNEQCEQRFYGVHLRLCAVVRSASAERSCVVAGPSVCWGVGEGRSADAELPSFSLCWGRGWHCSVSVLRALLYVLATLEFF